MSKAIGKMVWLLFLAFLVLIMLGILPFLSTT
jgi:hypothetical protein